jgi:hypothetical protein
VEKIRALIDAIVLTPEEGKLRVDLTGALAGILCIASKAGCGGPIPALPKSPTMLRSRVKPSSG